MPGGGNNHTRRVHVVEWEAASDPNRANLHGSARPRQPGVRVGYRPDTRIVPASLAVPAVNDTLPRGVRTPGP
jgi:hypothetical protein